MKNLLWTLNACAWGVVFILWLGESNVIAGASFVLAFASSMMIDVT